MPFTTLISTDALAERLNLPDLVVVDCRFKLEDESWGEHAYTTGHIPGAVYADLDSDMAGAKTGTNGRHPLPSPADLTRTFGRLGIGNREQVVAYDQDSGVFASRFWWLLRWMNHPSVAVLDGGFAKWLAEGRPTSAAIEQRPEKVFLGTPRAGMVVDADEVGAHLGAGDLRLLDARAPARFRGEVEPIDRVAGHIPTAVNHFYQRNLDDRGTFHAADTLKAAFRESLGGVGPERVVCYCGSGVTACHNLLALEHAGLGGARLYPGSWSEWASDPSRPVVSERKP
jgi:thiosulfate/3-mercaptopyruvate sulfurtransferase